MKWVEIRYIVIKHCLLSWMRIRRNWDCFLILDIKFVLSLQNYVLLDHFKLYISSSLNRLSDWYWELISWYVGSAFIALLEIQLPNFCKWKFLPLNWSWLLKISSFLTPIITYVEEEIFGWFVWLIRRFWLGMLTKLPPLSITTKWLLTTLMGDEGRYWFEIQGWILQCHFPKKKGDRYQEMPELF